MASNISKITLMLLCSASMNVASAALADVHVQDITEKKDIASATTTTPSNPEASGGGAKVELKQNPVTEKVLPNLNPEAKSTETNYQGWEVDAGEVKISCVNPHAACAESGKVLDTLKDLYKAYSKGDLKTAAKYMDDDCTTFDEASKTLISGKKAVLEDMRKKIHEWETSDSPLTSYTMQQPYAKVNGDMAVVSFVAFKTFGGKNPQKFKSRCTDIFKKEDGIWKKLHYRSNWREVVASTNQ